MLPPVQERAFIDRPIVILLGHHLAFGKGRGAHGQQNSRNTQTFPHQIPPDGQCNPNRGPLA